MANPRKFSEKIALHNQKQAEETAAFEQIMREVSDATSREGQPELYEMQTGAAYWPPCSYNVNAVPKQHLHINQSLGSYRAGSLPNVNHIGSNSIDLKSALTNLDDMKQGRDTHMVYKEQRGRLGPMRTRPMDKRIDTSPYSGPYLSPPPDTSWRRSTSDSALNQSVMNPAESSLHSHSPGSPRRVLDGQQSGMIMLDACDPSKKQLIASQDGRPKSCCDVPRVPGINIYPSQQEPGTVQIPIGNNTGSLPDLTNFHFPSPLPTPLDAEDQSNSPYSTSPQTTSPSTLSPTSLSSRHVHRFSFVGVQGSQNSQGHSPGHSPIARRRHHPALVIGGTTQVPSLSQAPGVTLDNSGNLPLEAFPQSQYLYQSQQQQQQQQAQQTPLQQTQQKAQPHPQHQQHQQQHSPPQPQVHQHQQQSPQPQCSPPLISNSQIPAQHLNSLNTYRSPQPLSRPSPQNSPGLTVQGSPLGYRSGSPADTSHSAPQSPVSQNLSPASSPGVGPNSSPFSDQNYFINQAQAATLQQHFEQFTMLDNPVCTSINYNSSQNNSIQYSQAVKQESPEDGATRVGNQDFSTDPGYYSQSPSQLQYNQQAPVNPSGGSTQQTTPQTPNTPSSIPDIILTDFSSSTGDEMSRQEFVKQLGTAIAISGTSFDTDFFASDDTLREGLDPIDFDGLQMLSDPEMNVVADPATEDNFRLDRL